MEYRIEKDTMGEVQVPSNALWGAQTQRSINNFKIGNEQLPHSLIHALAQVKQAAARANHKCGVLPLEKCEAIIKSCHKILAGEVNNAFPLVIWQTGSGTQSNMNMNEVVARMANLENSALTLNANDDVNKSQSTNDVFPTAMRVASVQLIINKLLPAIEQLEECFLQKRETFAQIQKIGRTHLMDATPLTLGDEFGAYAAQLAHSKNAIINALTHLCELPIGGTAVGNGINAPKGYDEATVKYLCQQTQLPFTVAQNKFEGMASHDSFVEMSGALKRLATTLMKIGNDIRLLASGPRCGLAELTIPENEPGSSIMPGKVNPTQCEALTMVCCQVIGNDAAITTGAIQGHLQLNAFMPLIAKNIIHSIEILTDATHSFTQNCAQGIAPNMKNITHYYENSLMRITELTPIIGYYKAAEVAQYAHKNDLSLQEAMEKLQVKTEEKIRKSTKK